MQGANVNPANITGEIYHVLIDIKCDSMTPEKLVIAGVLYQFYFLYIQFIKKIFYISFNEQL